MPWFKIDDKFHSHKKTSRCGLAAVGMWSVLGSWCADQLTDGFVPDYVVREKGGRGWRKLADELVEVGYWEPAESDGDKGWKFHDWDDFNPSRDQVEEERRAARERMAVRRKFGRTTGELRDDFGRTSDDVRLPRPDPTRSSYGTTPPAPPEGGFRTRRRDTQPDPDPWETYLEIPPADPIEEPRP